MRGQARVLIISPASANANNGNWQTASRWAAFLQDVCEVRIQDSWHAEQDGDQPGADLMIALHARRSAPSIQAWRQRHRQAPLAVVLTGTDLYRDIQVNADARRSLALANRLVVLQDAALAELQGQALPQLPEVQVIYQSAPAPRMVPARAPSPFTTIMVGHLRAEKRPDTYMQAAHALHGLQMLHIGEALEEPLGQLARQTMRDCPHYQWLGKLAHAQTLARLAQSDLMVISSAMEGGANVIIEAVVAGVPVLASDISGNRGMLGADYGGYFPPGDATALAALIARAQADPAFLAGLAHQCSLRAPLFAPAREKAQVQALVRELMDNVGRLQ